MSPIIGLGQSWQIPHRDREIQVDGFLREWEGVPVVVLTPAESDVIARGEFKDQDVEVRLQAVWDDEAFYLAIEWTDDIWDVEQIRRRDAVFVTPDNRRRDRMLFFDNLKIHIRDLDYEYMLWMSPRVDDRGPYYWHRRRSGSTMEGATTPPVITPRQDGQRATIEAQFAWQDLRVKKKKRKKGFPLSLIVADSDVPGAVEENKLSLLKWLEWDGRMVFGPK